MSRGFANRAQQAQKLKLSKQGFTASKGVHYCSKCEKRKLKRKEKAKIEPSAPPPTYLVLLWTLICGGFTDYGDFIMQIIARISSCIMITFIAYDSLCLLINWYRRCTRPVLEPQMGYRSMDPYLKETIQIWCLFECLRDARTKRGMVAAITQYLQAHVKDSLFLYCYNSVMNNSYINDWTSDSGVDQIEEMLEDAFGSAFCEETRDEIVMLETQDGPAVPWHDAMDQAFSNWKEFRKSHICKKFTHLVNVIVSAGLCATSDLTFKMGNVSLFTPIVASKQLVAGDVFEAFYEAVSGFMKGGWRVFQTGEVSAFFMEDDRIADFENRYNQIRSWHGYALTGNLREFTEIDDNAYEAHLRDAITAGDSILKVVSRSQTFERKFITDRMERLRDYETEFTQLRTRGGLRISPFAICLFGQSGCGKSTLTSLTVNAGLIYNGLRHEKEFISTWADNDKYASSIRSHTNAIISTISPIRKRILWIFRQRTG